MTGDSPIKQIIPKLVAKFRRQKKEESCYLNIHFSFFISSLFLQLSTEDETWVSTNKHSHMKHHLMPLPVVEPEISTGGSCRCERQRAVCKWWWWPGEAAGDKQLLNLLLTFLFDLLFLSLLVVRRWVRRDIEAWCGWWCANKMGPRLPLPWFRQ